MARLLVAGVAVLDFVFQVETMPGESIKYRAADATITGGGCAANAAVAITRDGGEALLAARLGDDPVGSLILEGLHQDDVDTSLAHIATDGRSSFSSVYVDVSGERQIMNFRGAGLVQDAAWLCGVPQVDAVLVDNRWPQIARRGIEIAREQNVPCIVDGEAPIEGDPFTGATHVAFARQGLSAFSGPGAIEECLLKTFEKLRCWVCVTDGPQGVFYTADGTIQHIPTFSVDAVDTLGAGDVWHGIFALELARGTAEPAAVRRANAAAALKCTRFGGRNATPRRSETDQFLKENPV